MNAIGYADDPACPYPDGSATAALWREMTRSLESAGRKEERAGKYEAQAAQWRSEASVLRAEVDALEAAIAKLLNNV